MIKVEGLNRKFGNLRAVHDLHLDIEEGELYGFLGPNGAGKTTAIRMLNGLLEPTAGSIRIDKRTYQSDRRYLQSITGFVPDTPPLYDYLTGRQYIGFLSSLYGISARDRDALAEPLLEVFEMSKRIDELCKGYSHGMKKKIHIIAVLVTRPRVLFLDEPTTGLDPRSARALTDSLREACDQGTTIMLSTHILDTAERVCDRVGIIRSGKLQAEGTMNELRSQRGDGSLEEIFLRLTDQAEDAVAAPDYPEEVKTDAVSE